MACLDRELDLQLGASVHCLAQRRSPLVFVRGKIRHADHKTIVLHEGRQVLMNTETESVDIRHVAFID